MQGAVETEVKIRIGDVSSIAQRLREEGFATSVPRLFESNVLLDRADHELRRSGEILRIRQAGDQSVITFKGKGKNGPHKTREELETRVDSGKILGQVFAKLGYHPSFRYEKFRTEFKDPQDGAGVVTIDETPIGNFLELEGPGAWIDRTAPRLGFSRADYVLESYGRLYLAECERRGEHPADMVFPSSPK